MRKDIEILIDTGDIALASQNKFVLYPFDWVENESGLERYIYGEITLPATLSETTIKNKGIYISIPYTPVYREFCIRIKREYADKSYTFVYNPVNGSEWFVVQASKYHKGFANIHVSELITISESAFYIKLNKGIAELYSGTTSDVNIIPANTQNSNMLLKCVPTNCYRYPLNGVGLIRWTNSNIDHTNLTKILTREFESDGVRINSASYDYDTKNLYLDLDTAQVDDNGNT